MTCTSVQDDLKAYCDGELPLLRELAVRRHLSGCAVCREEVQLMEALQQELRTGVEESLTPELRARILSDVSSQSLQTPPASETPRRPRFAGPTLAWGAAAILLLGWLLLFPVLQPVRERVRSVTASQRSWLNQPSNQLAAPLDGGATAPVSTLSDSYSAHRQLERPSAEAAPAAVSAPAMPLSQRPMPEAKSRPVPLGVVGGDAPESVLRRVHKEASLTVVVADPETQSDAVEQMVKSSGGYVADNMLTTDDAGRKSAQMTLKVPEPQFETVLGQIAKLGEVQAKNITGQDITGQVSDAGQAEAVLESEAQQAQARLDTLGTKAKWEDDEQARDLRIQLAQSRARLQMLQKMAALSTLTVTLSEKPQAVPAAVDGFSSRLTGTTHAALGSLAVSAGALLTLLIWLLAYAPIWLPLALVTRHFLRLSQQRKAAPRP